MLQDLVLTCGNSMHTWASVSGSCCALIPRHMRSQNIRRGCALLHSLGMPRETTCCSDCQFLC